MWGTTRHKPPYCQHPGYISDAMYIPELIQNFQKLNRNVKFKSFLDIDIINEPELEEYNLILCGDGEVNCIVAKLLKFLGDALEIRYTGPTEPYFMDITSRVKHHMYGVVHIFRNPWAKEKNRNRFIIYVGGIGPIGTIASIKWLSENLLSSSLPNSPFVIVKGDEKEYQGFNGYENHCEHCCKVIEEINGEKRVYWEGKISNVKCVVRIYPK